MRVLTHVPLAPYTSLHCGGLAETFIEVATYDELLTALSEYSGKQLHFLGHGCNSLISDDGLAGITIHITSQHIDLQGQTVTVDAGVSWDSFVDFAIAHNLWGVELASGIPSSIGGAVVGNIAAYGQAVADTLTSIEVFDSSTNEIRTLTKDDLDFGYRYSMLQLPEHQHLCVLRATFQLSPTKTAELSYQSALNVASELGLSTGTLSDRRRIILETRGRAGSLRTKDSFNAGSFFRNPLVSAEQAAAIMAFDETAKTPAQLIAMNTAHGGESTRVSAAHVLLASGFSRGQVFGNVRLHPDHVLKIENTGSATAQEVYDVAQHIIATAKTKTGITLEPEVRFFGTFN